MIDFFTVFPKKVRITPSDCWEWTGPFSDKGYGVYGSPKRKAHRLMFEQCFGPIPPGMQILHACDNPPCCNPKHLRLGTNASNVLDRQQKGRTAKGEDKSNSKLNEAIVREMRALAGEMKTADIAQRFGVGNATVRRVLARRSWAHVK